MEPGLDCHANLIFPGYRVGFAFSQQDGGVRQAYGSNDKQQRRTCQRFQLTEYFSFFSVGILRGIEPDWRALQYGSTLKPARFVWSSGQLGRYYD